MVEPEHPSPPETLEEALVEIARLRDELGFAARMFETEANWYSDFGSEKTDTTWRHRHMRQAASFFNVRRFWHDG